MANQEPARNVSTHALDAGSIQDQSSPLQPPFRRDTQSTTSSETPPPLIPPGFYSLRLHGNCPRCHHSHKAAAIRIRISRDHISPIDCKKCGSPWLALGGNNSTSLSLLSTQTIDLDPTDIGFRTTLIEMVRSLAAVGSPAALASVPELPSRGTSRQPSVRSSNRPTVRGDHQPSPVEGQHGASGHKLPLPLNPKSLNPEECSPAASKSKRALSFLSELKGRLKERFPIMRKLRLERFNRFTKKPKMTAKGMGKLPVFQPPIQYDQAAQPKPRKPSTILPNREHTEVLNRDEDGAYQKTEANNEAIDRFKRSKEKLKGMNHEQRAQWIREQISDVKCQCPRNCHCRRASTRTDGSSHRMPSIPSLSPVASQYIAQRRRSTELLGIGGFTEGFNDDHSTRPLSIDSTTRMSSLQLPLPAQPTQRSRPPRPRSNPVGSRLREQLGQDADEDISSVDSARAVGSLAGTGRQDRDEYPALALPSMPLDDEDLTTLVNGHQGSSAHVGNSAEDSITPSASTHHLSGYRTSDERTLRDSFST